MPTKSARRRKANVRPGPVGAAEANERTESIIRIATEEFLARGYEDTTLSQIARRSRVSKTTLYALFESKEALFSHVVTSSIANYRTAIEHVLDVRLPMRNVVRDVVAATVSAVSDKSANSVLRLVVAEARRFPVMAHLSQARARGLIEPLQNYFNSLDQRLTKTEANYLARHLSNMAMGGYACLLVAPSVLFGSKEEWIDAITDIFVRGFLNRRRAGR